MPHAPCDESIFANTVCMYVQIISPRLLFIPIAAPTLIVSRQLHEILELAMSNTYPHMATNRAKAIREPITQLDDLRCPLRIEGRTMEVGEIGAWGSAKYAPVALAHVQEDTPTVPGICRLCAA